MNPYDNPWGGWPGQDARGWGGWAPHDPRWGHHRGPVHPNQLGHRMPSGGPPPPGLGALWLALVLLVVSPLVLLAGRAGAAARDRLAALEGRRRRGRYEHLMVARTTISDGWRARARALVALARSLRPDEALPGARAWRDAREAAQGALAGLAGHLAIQPPPDHHEPGDGGPGDNGPPSARHVRWDGDGPDRPPGASAEPEPRPVTAARHRLRLAVATAARQADTDTIRALVGEADRRGLATAELVAVAERHWPRLRVRARRAGRRWAAGSARWAWTHRPRRAASGRVIQQQDRP